MPAQLSLTTADVQAAGAPPIAPQPEAAPAAPAPAAPEAPAEAGPQLTSHPAAMLDTLPPDLLENPMIFAVAKGQPAAVSAPDKSKDPVVKSVAKHAQPLVAAGFGIYTSIDGKTQVLFNTQMLHPGDLQEADQQGRLLDVAPPFETVNQKSPAGAGAAPPQAMPGQPAPMPESQPAPSVQTKLATQRTANLQAPGPTGGPAPGAGSILNSILRRPV